MKRIGIIGVCFAAVFALSALVASSALANPQFYHCKEEAGTAEALLKVGPFETQGKCEKLENLGTGSKWFFSEYKGTELTKIEGISLEGILNGLAAGIKVTVKCEKDKILTGSINSGKASMLVSEVLVEYEKCKVGTTATPCTGNVATVGNIMTKKIMATLGYTVAAGGGENNVGLVFEPEVAGAFAAFTCTGLPEVVVTKQVVGLIPKFDAGGSQQINVMRSAWELRFECTVPVTGDRQRHEGLLLLGTPNVFAEGLHLVAFGAQACLEDVVHIKTVNNEVGEIMA